MKIINESVNSTVVYFATDRKFVPPFNTSEEGIHVELSLDELYSVFEGLRSKDRIYSILLPFRLKPCYIDEDILFWSGPNLAKLFLCKYNNEPYEECFEGQGDITPNMVHIDILDSDIATLEKIASMDETERSFELLFKFLNKKGYNCISYLIYEGNRTTDRAICLSNNTKFNYDTLKLVEQVK